MNENGEMLEPRAASSKGIRLRGADPTMKSKCSASSVTNKVIPASSVTEKKRPRLIDQGKKMTSQVHQH